MGVQLSPAVAANSKKSRHGAARCQAAIDFTKDPVDETGPALDYLSAVCTVEVRFADESAFL